MSAMFYVMAVFGCADGGGQCVEARLAERRFATEAECRRAVEDVLGRSTDVDAPSITARCMSARSYVSAQRDKQAATLRLASLQSR